MVPFRHPVPRGTELTENPVTKCVLSENNHTITYCADVGRFPERSELHPCNGMSDLVTIPSR